MSAAANPAVRQSRAQPSPQPYAVLLLPSVFNGTVDQQRLLLPLTLAYLLSTHVPLRFPIADSALATVERAFDSILDGMPKESKGILYVTGVFPQQTTALLQSASLLITDEAGSEQGSGMAGLPQAILCRVGEQAQVLRLRNLEKLRDAELKAKLVGCAQLINVQAAGFTTEGHFSLSW